MKIDKLTYHIYNAGYSDLSCSPFVLYDSVIVSLGLVSQCTLLYIQLSLSRPYWQPCPLGTLRGRLKPQYSPRLMRLSGVEKQKRKKTKEILQTRCTKGTKKA